MANSELEIVNSALHKLGVERILSFSDDSKRARISDDMYEIIRDEVLASHPWNFAIKRVELAATVSTPEFEYTYEYQLPNDCLRVLDTDSTYGSSTSNFVIEGRKVLSDESTLKIRYIYRNTNVYQYSPQFTEALATRLAASMAYSIVQSSEREKQLLEIYEKLIKEARSADAQEGLGYNIIEAATWINARN